MELTLDEAEEIDIGQMCVQYDPDEGCWNLIGTISGYCYAEFDTEEDAEEALSTAGTGNFDSSNDMIEYY